MTCSDLQRILPDIMDGAGDLEFQSHLKSCPLCSELVSDLKLIASQSQELAYSEEPPDRVWVSIANQLRAEGIIREPKAAPARPVLVPTARGGRVWRAWWLAPVAVAVIVAGSYQLTHRAIPSTTSRVAEHTTIQSPAAQSGGTDGVTQPPKATESAAGNVQLAQDRARSSTRSKVGHAAVQAENSPPPSAEDEEFLSEVSTRAPSMRATYENELLAVNKEIRETLEYINLHPDDLDARQHLLEAYQHKAMLYQMALDRIQ